MSDRLAGNQDTDILFLTDEGLRQNIELLFFAYKDFTSDPDRILIACELGRAHHRALYFINRRSGLTVSELLGILGITKQSLNRVLRKLIEMDYVRSEVGHEDRRERRLSLTDKGAEFEAKLAEAQQARIRSAFAKAGPEAVRGFRNVLSEILDPNTLAELEKSMQKNMQTSRRRT